MTVFPFEAEALRIEQPLGTFYVAVLPARLLLQVATSDTMTATLNSDGKGYSLSGTQRLIQEKRLNQIADYIDRIDAAFPNSVILAANFNREYGLDQDEFEAIQEEAADENVEQKDDNSRSWTVDQRDGRFVLRIPSPEKLAAIIDGQHRLFAFAKAAKPRLDMELLCAIFLDLPKPFQAQLFATINSTQKPVDRSLTFELFGYNVSDEPESFWTPDKLAVFLARKLGTEDDSPLRGRITVAPKRDAGLQELAEKASWRVSTAVVVDGILRLISNNPKRDANAMRSLEEKTRSALSHTARDKSPLRSAFIGGNDNLIFQMVKSYLQACNDLFWRDADLNSYILKTVGVQALFDILRILAPGALEAKNLKVNYFSEKLAGAAEINFADQAFQVPAGKGRSIIRKAIEARLPA